MAQPITWQNVTGPSMGNPAQFMQMAQNGVDGAFDKLQNVLKQRETTDKANYDQVGVNNAEAFKSALYGITTPEQMAAAKQSGQFNDMLTGYGSNVKDPGALRALMEGRMGVLQKQSTDGIAYDNTIADNKEAPFISQAKALYSQGNVVAGDLAAANVNRGSAELAEFSRIGQRRGVTESQADAANAHLVATRPLTIKGLESGLETAEAQRRLIEEQAGLASAQADEFTRRAKAGPKSTGAGERAYTELKESSQMDGGTLDTVKGKKTFMDALKGLNLGDAEKDDIVEQFAKRFAGGVGIGNDKDGKPIKIGVPVSVALDAINSSSENIFARPIPHWSRRGDDAANIFQNRMDTDKDLRLSLQAFQQAQNARIFPALGQAATAMRSRSDQAAWNKSNKEKPAGDDLDDLSVSAEDFQALLETVKAK